ncbi:Uncharacterized conserved protein, DUF305 family [Micromonospora sediminicola]|uniref:Uncharacterized conserved protein, DUF305 family n=1 Tax=Micromonospora sediminicola TaxID=946078 RepID=A0A1A9BCV4_9ACTN|nr:MULTISPECIES: DUF305 domain-containing protein [Micromonospora]PGH45050.1 DUF305 domain-containing protein [Micromonospora sp. WMMA1996]SBT66896.1 Uncharacterized conserved protein, DUF305 family [Micromonospora sediminicola]
MRRPFAAALLAALLAAGVAGCGGSSPAPATPRPTPAVDDTTSGIDALFLAMMVAHTAQTLEIVDVGLGRVTDTEVRTLISAVRATEADELATMRGWLREAGPSAAAAAARHDHTGHSDAAAGLARLRAASAADVDRVLLDVLAAHQRTAAALARAQVAAGTSARVRDLAARIDRSRTAEVALMATLRPASRR